MSAVAKELIEHHTDSEQVRGDVPTSELRIRGLIWRRTRLSADRVANPRGDVEVEKLRALPGQHHIEWLDVAMHEPFLLKRLPLTKLGLRQTTVLPLRIKLSQAHGIGLNSG